MIKVFCPHCNREIQIEDESKIYNLKRINNSTYQCKCQKKFLIYYDENNIKTLRISRK